MHNGSGGLPDGSAARPSWPRGPDPAVDGRHLKELLGILRRNVGLVLSVALAVLAAAGYWAFSRQPIYQALAVIRLADVRGALTGGFDDYATQTPLGRTTNLITSELEVLLGRTVLGEVVDREGLRLIVAPGSELTDDLLTDVHVAPDAASRRLRLRFEPRGVVVQGGPPEVRAAYGARVDLPGLSFTVRAAPRSGEAALVLIPREFAIDVLADGLRVAQRGNTNAVSVRFAAPDPLHAQRVVNAAVEVFRDYNARSARQQAQLRRRFLEEQLRRHELTLSRAQQAFGEFQAREQVYSSGDRLVAQEQALMELAMRREELDADRRIYLSHLSTLEGAPAAERGRLLETLVSALGITSNPAITQLYAQRAEYEMEFDRLTTGPLGSTVEHPEVQRLQSLIAATEERLIDAVRSHIAALEARVAALDELRQRTADEMRRLPEAHAEEVRLAEQLQALGRIGEKLTEELQDARMAEAVETGQVEIVSLASLPLEPTNAGPARKLGVGVVLGLIFGCAAAFGREMLNTSIRRRDELEDALRLPGLAVVPRLAPSPGVAGHLRRSLQRDGGAPPDRWPPGTATVEAYRMLRSHLVFGRPEEPPRRIAVTSARAGEGKTTTAANLARTFAQHGTRVLLIDCDLHDPALHERFGMSQAPGVTDVLQDRVALEDAVRPTGIEDLYLLPAGSAGPEPVRPVSEHRLAGALERLSRRFELILLDTPPVLEVADAAVIGRLADGCIFVVRAGETERALAQQAHQQLALVGARVLGAVLNDPSGKAERYERAGPPRRLYGVGPRDRDGRS